MTEKLKLKILFLIYIFFPAWLFLKRSYMKFPDSNSWPKERRTDSVVSDRRQLAAVSPTFCSSVQRWMNPGRPIDVHPTSDQRRASHVKRATLYQTKWHEFKPIDHEKILFFLYVCVCEFKNN